MCAADTWTIATCMHSHIVCTLSVSLPPSLGAVVSARTFPLHFKPHRRLMFCPQIIEGKSLLGFKIGAEHASSSHFSLSSLSSSCALNITASSFISMKAPRLCRSGSFYQRRCVLSTWITLCCLPWGIVLFSPAEKGRESKWLPQRWLSRAVHTVTNSSVLQLIYSILNHQLGLTGSDFIFSPVSVPTHHSNAAHFLVWIAFFTCLLVSFDSLQPNALSVAC